MNSPYSYTDDELTRLCAEAMGWKHLGPVGVLLLPEERRGSIADARYPGKLWCLSGQNDWWQDPEGRDVCEPCTGSVPDPLNNDAHAMALIKRFSLDLTARFKDASPTIWRVRGTVSGWEATDNENLNRAVAECVAKMQAYRSTATPLPE